jgi:hypothetical protein
LELVHVNVGDWKKRWQVIEVREILIETWHGKAKKHEKHETKELQNKFEWKTEGHDSWHTTLRAASLGILKDATGTRRSQLQQRETWWVFIQHLLQLSPNQTLLIPRVNLSHYFTSWVIFTITVLFAQRYWKSTLLHSLLLFYSSLDQPIPYPNPIMSNLTWPS